MIARHPKKWISGAFILGLLVIVGCSDSGTDATRDATFIVDPNAPVQASGSELSIEVSGDLRHSSDECFRSGCESGGVVGSRRDALS